MGDSNLPKMTKEKGLRLGFPRVGTLINQSMLDDQSPFATPMHAGEDTAVSLGERPFCPKHVGGQWFSSSNIRAVQAHPVQPVYVYVARESGESSEHVSLIGIWSPLSAYITD